MKRFGSLLVAAAVMLSLAVPMSAAHAGDIAKTYFNKRTWQTMDWPNADKSALWNDAGWEDFRGTQSEDVKFLKEQGMTVAGVDLTANLIYDTEKHIYASSISSAVDGIDRAGCDALAAAATKQFGKPVSVDQDVHMPIAPDTVFAMTEQVLEWTIGKTRISTACNGSATIAGGRMKDEKTMVWIMRFDDIRSVPKTERIPLLCDREMRFPDGRVEKYKDQTLFIDPARNRALDPNLIPISESKTFEQSETEFKFTQDLGDGLVLNYAINRMSGTLIADAVQGGRKVGQISGTCQKVEKLEKKF